MKLYSEEKSQDAIGWDNMIWGRIDIHWNKWQKNILNKLYIVSLY